MLVILLSGCSDSSKKPAPQPAISVTSTKVQKENIPETIPGVGSIRAIEISTMAPEVAGNVIGRYFEDGQRVTRGDILYTLDRRTQEAQLNSTKAQLAEQQWVWERMKILAETQAASDAEVAETAYNIESLTAQVAELQSVVDKLTIRAPYDGQVAIHMIDIGTYANVGDELVKVVNDSVMLVDYELATSWLPKLKVGQAITLMTEAQPGRSYSGRVTAINPFVNSNTRSVQVRSQVPNPDFSLHSGLFADVVQIVGSYENVLVVPQASLVYTGNDVLVYAVDAGQAVPVPVVVTKKISDSRAIITAVPPTSSGNELSSGAHKQASSSPAASKSGASNANQSASSSSASTGHTTGSTSSLPHITLKEGLEIVVEGAAKLRPGAKVKTTPYQPVHVSVVTGMPKRQSSGRD
ncbi:MAG: efflux RND transporter periplasmic adaptor subunit [Planctomycetota bacterium]|nr:efflux RND transporter periplasmic adaptor subunit [Planctomycetota bacterium]